MIDTALAYVYAPLRPLLQRLNITREGRRLASVRDVMLPEGFEAEVVATDLNAPVQATFGPDGACYVSEAGYQIDTAPRVLRVDVATGAVTTFFQLPEERWSRDGAFTGGCWLDGHFYFANNDRISRVLTDGSLEDVVTGLPWGDHMPSYPVVGPDGRIYFTTGSATNCGVVGADNYTYGWLRHFHSFCDVPGQDVTLVGSNFEFKNVLGDVGETVRTGAFVPFGTETAPGQVVPGAVKCTTGVFALDVASGEVELLAWGLRNAFGISFHPDGRLFVTEHGIDERGARFIVGDPDDFYEVKQGAWYGWPDYASGVRLDDPQWGDGGRGREPVLADPPDPSPPLPFVSFRDHAASNGFDFCRDPAFGFEGDAFVCLYGSVAPVTTRRSSPAGFKVVRVDMARRQVVNFAVNRYDGPSSMLPHGGLERPSHCVFGPDGCLYIVDWGEIRLAPERGGIEMPLGSGILWRVRRTSGPPGERPPEPIHAPLSGWVGLPPISELIAMGKRKRRPEQGRSTT
jgi:glucose/arabinose dehydrogenase